MNHKNRNILKNSLTKLNKNQLKLFYSMIVHYWVSYRFFISKQHLYNLWCKLNNLCYEVDENFPDPYGDQEKLKLFCQAHPYYFIDILSTKLVVNLFCQHLDNNIDILTMIATKLHTEGLYDAYVYSNIALDLAENIDDLVADAEEHLKIFS